jgi:hypothetical protein
MWRKGKIKKTGTPTFQCMNPNAAGVDVGAMEIYIAVPADRDPQPVRRFSTFTEDLHAAADWLKASKIETVAMESTGVYWIPLFQILEERGFTVLLVNARHVKNVPGRNYATGGSRPARIRSPSRWSETTAASTCSRSASR